MKEITHSGATVVRYWARAIFLAAVSAALVALSFHGALDDFAHEKITDTTTQSIGMYAAARLTNAAISVLQTSEVKVPFLASVQIGELLDPVNDVVERLSSAIAWAIGSLLLQRIILEVASSPVFKWVFLALGLAAISVLLLFEWKRSRISLLRMLALSEAMLNRYRIMTVQVFVIAVVFRFIVPVFISLGFIFSQMFLESEIRKNTEALTSFSEKIHMGSADDVHLSDDDLPLADQKRQLESELDGLAGALESLNMEAEILDQEIDKLKDETGWRRWLPESLGGLSPGETSISTKAKRAEIGRELDQVQRRFEGVRENIECIDRRLAGKTCESFWDRFSSAGKAGYSRIVEHVDMSGDIATNIVKLLVAVIISNIIIPIVFLIIAIKCCLPIIRYSMWLVQDARRDVRALRNMQERTDRDE